MDVDSPAQNAPSQARAPAWSSNRIPPLTHLGPSVFVPIEEDLTEPVDLPRDRVDRLKWILNTIESQRTGVSENLMYIFERERDRILAEAQEREAISGPPDMRRGLHPNEADQVISNMSTPHQPGRNYHVESMGPPSIEELEPRPLSNREEAVWKLLELVERALDQTQGYDKAMDTKRGYYLGMLEKERQKIDEVGRRPEERSKTRP